MLNCKIIKICKTVQKLVYREIFDKFFLHEFSTSLTFVSDFAVYKISIIDFLWKFVTSLNPEKQTFPPETKGARRRPQQVPQRAPTHPRQQGQGGRMWHPHFFKLVFCFVSTVLSHLSLTHSKREVPVYVCSLFNTVPLL